MSTNEMMAMVEDRLRQDPKLRERIRRKSKQRATQAITRKLRREQEEG